ncbi:SGNH hydrolase-type esterase domain-containing protein [Aspergillus pseudoustus]|uniref:SGNH hydrolase-type esterase domain-containing protein n=1 Tax=Aspergillus pseudoustus TaxID=1810923 RepID=A0ABR4KF57_9EURO
MRRSASMSTSTSTISTTSATLTYYYLSLFTLLSLFAPLAASYSLSSPSDRRTDNNEDSNTQALAARDTKPFLLRVMPLGASITVGYRSTDGNGYRQPLREQLRYAGWEVDMVGSLTNGTMKDNQNEGHFGDTIEQITKWAEKSVDMQPNVILINAGTNDGIQNRAISGADDRMSTLIDHLYSAIPNTTIILSTLIPNKHAQRVVQRISSEYRTLAARRRAAGDRLVLAEMSYFISSDYLVDGTHPDDEGYKAMAAVWWAAVQEAEREGFLAAPNVVTASGSTSSSTSNVSVLVATERNGTEGDGLDDGAVADPKLPSYVAPAQPSTEDGGAVGSLRWGWGWGVLVAQVFVLACLVS